ncbi:MAG: helix-hairpin-helix domain-containing protein, partial [candidate division WOR-3 bacterium]
MKKNQKLSHLFSRIADALEIKGETGFRVLAYRRVARVLANLTDDVAVLDQTGSLEQIPGIGPKIAKKIHEFLATGRMKKYEEATAGLPAGLFDLLDLQGIGPKTVKLLYEQLGVSDRQMLLAAVESGKLATLPGMGEKKAANIIQALRAGRTTGERMYLDEAFELAESVVEHMMSGPGVRQVSYGGSLRRGCETIGDIDILATGTKPERIAAHFLTHPWLRQQLGAGQTKASARFEIRGRERQVDLRVVQDQLFGAALQYFTGSKEHNVAVRALAQKRGLKLSEYGLFRGRRRIAGRTEAEVYHALGLPYIEPELRENRGELEAAARGELPELVTAADIKSDLHIHTNLSDGTATFDELVAAARNRGYTHVAFADHSVSAHYAGGRSAEQLLRYCDTVDE